MITLAAHTTQATDDVQASQLNKFSFASWDVGLAQAIVRVQHQLASTLNAVAIQAAVQVVTFVDSIVVRLRMLPIYSYETLTAKEAIRALDGLTADELTNVRQYEANHKNRTSVQKALSNKLRIHNA